MRILEGMSEPESEVPERPATWENVVVGKATEMVGRALRKDEMVEEGEEQTEIAHEVHEEYEDEQHDRPADD